jgi:1-piperideine-2-carboxylate/1-pyrroline-2-carboxylate reductase [NAD(P)H]
LIQAGFDWSAIRSLAQTIHGKRLPDGQIFFKSVGCAAWDLAACRVARDALYRMYGTMVLLWTPLV